ncbi:MAG: VCBS repeat-containing protein [Verrucomicrobiales bacterium]|nr:VCBS repeat-containing protein [Verrucomicrobiales bacterium]
MKIIVSLSLLLLFSPLVSATAETWKKHTVMDAGRNLTAVAADYDGDGDVDVIASYPGKISLFFAPDWKEVVLHRFPKMNATCIHSETFDVDGDGDPDWIGTQAFDKPFWLENPGGQLSGNGGGAWAARIIDHDIRGIHCILKADVDNDGKLDVIINNFEPEGVLGDSIAWFSVPKKWKEADRWDRHVFADRNARGGSHYFGFGDIDGDGWGEIAVGAKGKPFADGNWFAYWKNPGKDEVTEPWEKTIISENQLAATNILPGDLNGDGKPDFLASRGHSAGVLWFEAPDWNPREIDPEIKSPHSLVLADLDNDGDLDGATCGFESERVAWYENDGKGNFTIHVLDEAQQSYDLRSVDMDGDGDLDLLNAGRATGNVAWYENPTK